MIVLPYVSPSRSLYFVCTSLPSHLSYFAETVTSQCSTSVITLAFQFLSTASSIVSFYSPLLRILVLLDNSTSSRTPWTTLARRHVSILPCTYLYAKIDAHHLHSEFPPSTPLLGANCFGSLSIPLPTSPLVKFLIDNLDATVRSGVRAS